MSTLYIDIEDAILSIMYCTPYLHSYQFTRELRPYLDKHDIFIDIGGYKRIDSKYCSISNDGLISRMLPIPLILTNGRPFIPTIK